MADLRFGGLTCDQAAEDAAGFVLGALDPAAERAVRTHLAECPEAHPAFEELGGVVPALLESVTLEEPPAGLRGRILGAVAAEAGSARPTPVPAAPPATVIRLDDAARRRRWAPRTAPSAWLLRMAAVMAVVVLGAWNLSLQSRLDDAARYQAAVTAVFDLAARPGSASAVLATGSGTGASGFAALAGDGSVAIAVHGLAPTAGPAVYEAWVIIGDGAPVPIGGFAVGADGVGRLTTSAAGAGAGTIVALTLEPAAGATTPTLPIIVSGAAETHAG